MTSRSLDLERAMRWEGRGGGGDGGVNGSVGRGGGRKSGSDYDSDAMPLRKHVAPPPIRTNFGEDDERGRREPPYRDGNSEGYGDDEEEDEYEYAMEGLKQPDFRTRLQRRLWGYLRNPIILLCILAIFLVTIISIAVRGSGPNSTPAAGEKKKVVDKRPLYDFSMVGDWTFYPVSASYKWVEHELDGSYVTRRADNAIVIEHVQYPDNVTVLAEDGEIRDVNGRRIYFQDFFVSPDLKRILVETNRVKGWRHSFFADYYIFDVETKKTRPLTTSKADKSIPGELGNDKVALALWSPSGHSVAWVRENDLFVTIDGETEVRITTDGSKQTINGIADWVYEEEVLGTHDAMWFSPDGTQLAYLKSDETKVPEYRLQYYEQPRSLYPHELVVKYPKAGAPNPIVTLHIATPSVSSNANLTFPVTFPPSQMFAPDDSLIVEVKWMTSNDTLLVRVMNRVQDVQRIFMVKKIVVPEGATVGGQVVWNATLVRDEPSRDGAWFNLLQPITYVPPSATNPDRLAPSYIELMEDADGYTHLAYFGSISASKPTAWLTNGKWEVTSVVGVDVEKDKIYYLSTEEGSMQRQLYSVYLNGFNKTKLTPPPNVSYPKQMPLFKLNLNSDSSKPVAGDEDGVVSERKKEGETEGEKDKVGKHSAADSVSNPEKEAEDKIGDIGYFEASFSPKCQYYLLNYKGPEVPFSRVIKVDDDWSSDVQDNKQVREAIEGVRLPKTKHFTIENDEGDDMNAMMSVPADFDESDNKTYPVLMRVYGGPNSQMASYQFELNWMTAMANAGFVTLVVDGRGTGFKGRKYRAAVSKQLGHYEVVDQIAGAKFLTTLGFVDKERIAIWGWSYGGYTTAKVIEADSGYFSVGMSVAPVTDWMLYDSVYTERYMKTPEMNPEGYKQSAVTNMTGFLHDRILLVHGTADDNVHFQNSADLVWHLTKQAVRNYRVQYYTDSDHSMGAGGASTEIYELLKNYLFEQFGLQRPNVVRVGGLTDEDLKKNGAARVDGE
ncbi:hypothetical protein HK102_007706 [Quaeritorhiza haematococci]|nr:hypothetical protein HK102_007706 [Quaeritorhiza haematococci]